MFKCYFAGGFTDYWCDDDIPTLRRIGSHVPPTSPPDGIQVGDRSHSSSTLSSRVRNPFRFQYQCFSYLYFTTWLIKKARQWKYNKRSSLSVNLGWNDERVRTEVWRNIPSLDRRKRAEWFHLIFGVKSKLVARREIVSLSQRFPTYFCSRTHKLKKRKLTYR